jgi:uncharacterized integral membrane protein
MYNISTSRICNAKLVPISNPTLSSTIQLTFIITDNISSPNQKNDYLPHQCVSDWITYDFTNAPQLSTIVNVASATFPTQLQSKSCPAYNPSISKFTSDVKTNEIFVASKTVVQDASVYNNLNTPATYDTLSSDKRSNDISPAEIPPYYISYGNTSTNTVMWIVLGVGIVLFVIIVVILFTNRHDMSNSAQTQLRNNYSPSYGNYNYNSSYGNSNYSPSHRNYNYGGMMFDMGE